MATVEIEVVGKDSFSGALGNLGSIITGIESAIRLASDAFRVFGDLAMQGLDAIASYERMGTSLQALSASQLVMAGTAADMNEALQMTAGVADELLGWVQELAINSPFTQEGVAAAFQMAMAYGFNVEESKRLTAAMLDYAAASGQGEFAMERIARALGQISAMGKVTGGDILQLTAVGVPAMQILADHFGVSTAEIMKMREDGLIPAQDAIEAITGWMETNFAGAGARFTQTWAGMIGTFEDLKQMGLREFFGSMFEVLQPLASSLSSWLQTEGMEKLGEWGAMLGEFTQSIVDRLPAALAMIQELKQAFDTGGMTAVIQVALGDITLQDMVDFMDRLDVALADAVNAGIESGAFRESGDAFGELVAGLFSGGFEGQESEAVPAIGQALSDWFRGAVGDVYFENSLRDIVSALFGMLLDSIRDGLVNAAESAHEAWVNFWINVFRPDDMAPFEYSAEMGQEMVRGLLDGLNSIEIGITNWVRDHIVDPIKDFLGIASPSTVFMEIGRNLILGLIQGIVQMISGLPSIMMTLAGSIVAGLISGWGNAFNTFLSIIETGVNAILELFAPVLDLFNIDLNIGGSTGTVGSGPGDTSHTPGGGGTLTGTSSVVNNFFGPVYFGDMEQLGYDCPSPHPLVAASAASLVTSGIG
jgi:tape measure domain-containing protein